MSTKLWHNEQVGLTVTALVGPERTPLLELAVHNLMQNPRLNVVQAQEVATTLLGWAGVPVSVVAAGLEDTPVELAGFHPMTKARAEIIEVLARAVAVLEGTGYSAMLGSNVGVAHDLRQIIRELIHAKG